MLTHVRPWIIMGNKKRKQRKLLQKIKQWMKRVDKLYLLCFTTHEFSWKSLKPTTRHHSKLSDNFRIVSLCFSASRNCSETQTTVRRAQHQPTFTRARTLINWRRATKNTLVFRPASSCSFIVLITSCFSYRALRVSKSRFRSSSAVQLRNARLKIEVQELPYLEFWVISANRFGNAPPHAQGCIGIKRYEAIEFRRIDLIVVYKSHSQLIFRFRVAYRA